MQISRIQNVSFNSHHYSHTKPITPSDTITITNFHPVDETLMRGAKPTQAQLQELKNNGVKTIISFCTNYNPQTKKYGGLPEEANWAEKLGMKFYWMPMHSTENPMFSDVDKFLQVTDNARTKGEKVFIHCRHGADRTGVFSAIYRLTNQNVKLSDVIRELMAYGHDANHNPNIIPFLIDYKESLNPFNKIINTGKEFMKKIINKGIQKCKI